MAPFFILLLACPFGMFSVKAQDLSHDQFHDQSADFKKGIETRSRLWNTSYNSHDSLTFYSLFDSAAILTSGGGSWIGLEKCKDLCRGLYVRRPDITWYNQPTGIEFNEPWHIGYETGNWREAWTEKGDSTKSEITGKYWIMWRLKDAQYYIVSAIFTPLSCTGSYCNLAKKR